MFKLLSQKTMLKPLDGNYIYFFVRTSRCSVNRERSSRSSYNRKTNVKPTSEPVPAARSVFWQLRAQCSTRRRFLVEGSRTENSGLTRWRWMVHVDAVAESRKNPVSKHQIHPGCGELAG